MFYIFTRFFVRLALVVFCRRVTFLNKEYLNISGPLLLACNHPNSFFDAVLLGAYFKRPVHFLARGDAFKNPVAKKLLSALKAIPIYRLREGKEFLALNDHTFDQCDQVLKAGGIVLIFSEGLCLNHYQLRPLKKGTARIALHYWNTQNDALPLQVLPVSLNYSSFTSFSKNVIVHFGTPIQKNDLPQIEDAPGQMIALNNIITSSLKDGMLLQNQNGNIIRFILSNCFSKMETLKQVQLKLSAHQFEVYFAKLTEDKVIALSIPNVIFNIAGVIIFFVPGVIGWIVHLPLYYPLKKIVKHKTAGTVFYHSALFAALLILYPLYCLLLTAILYYITTAIWVVGVILVMPLFAITTLHFKTNITRIHNHFKLTGKQKSLLEKIIVH